MEKQRRTFLSYSRANKDFAVKLARELKSEGFAVWLDQLDIPPGSRWDVEVEKALTDCEIFMIIITQASIVSDNVLDEIGYAIDNGKRFLPVLLEKCNVPLRLRRFQYVDFTDKSFDEGVESAKELLRTLISQPTVPQKDAAGTSQVPVDQKPKAADDHSSAEASGASSATTTTANLRREKVEQELRFKAETERLLHEKADLEKKLQEEHDTHERMEAAKAKDETRPAPPQRRSKLIGIFGISILAILIAGFAVTRFLSAPASVNVPTETQDPLRIPPRSRMQLISSPLRPKTHPCLRQKRRRSLTCQRIHKHPRTLYQRHLHLR